MVMSTGLLVSSGVTVSHPRSTQRNVYSCSASCRSITHTFHRVCVRRPNLLRPGAACVSCSAVVERPQEVDLQSVDLGWPRGFPSRYALGEQLGRGSFGVVYLATDRVSGEEVAAKIIPKERKGTTREHILGKIQQEVWQYRLSSGSVMGVQSVLQHPGGCAASHARETRSLETSGCL